MRMNRRNVLAGLGTIVAGGGAALGTGAFSQVSADRTVSVDVAGDANAFLALTAVASTGAVTNNGGSGNELKIDLSSSFATGSGVNDGAITTIGKLDKVTGPSSVDTAAFTVTNNGNTPVDISVTLSGSNTSILQLPTQVDSTKHTTTTTDFSGVADLSSNTLEELDSGASANVVVKINTETGSDSTGTGAITGITFTATA